MEKILLACGAGLSTSLLVNNMVEADVNHNYEIKCCDTVSAKVLVYDYDIFLLAPHIAYMKDEFKNICDEVNIPFMLIDTMDYTKMNGKAVLDKTVVLLNEHKKENPFKVVFLHGKRGMMSNLIILDIKKKVKDYEKNWVFESVVDDDFEDDRKTNIVLLESQINFEKDKIMKKIINPLTVVDVPPRDLFASFDGRKVLDYIHQLYDKEINVKKEKLKERLEDI
ncbi:MAG: PTS sugar transporter subunit IIB [Erysipelotrichaceae bacterium]|nr:PTS sugar transporter subunit IIB [Erysipelotrichaceae bacterium]